MVNKVFLIGRIGKDPVVKHFSNDSAVAEFTLATDDSYKNKHGDKVEQTDWHNIKIMSKKSAEIAEKYLKKGSLVHIEGKIKTRSYDDKDGNKRYVTEIVCETFKMLDSKKEAGQQTGTNSYKAEEQAPANTVDDSSDLPF